ncbi:MAG: thioredoxin domain-containing protein [Nitriliruptoraceae bacterium]
MPNRLAEATSPYLLQHADNPVDWFEWGDEAFAAARDCDVPIFLSVGYSACHWCHVMQHESFENEAIAAQLNANFVSIKVDREERPDVDAVYMQAVTALTRHGGWPMSVFLTPNGEPFFAGTYWPPTPRQGMPGFGDVLDAVTDAWQHRRDEVASSAARIRSTLAQHATPEPDDGVDLSVGDAAAEFVLTRAWDRNNGGFGQAPKFPQAMTIEWLLHHHARTGNGDALDCALQALDAMANGGLHDQLGGGFARYSTDARWLVPHFEKMLYDNAFLLAAYATAATVADREDLADIAESIVGYLCDEMQTSSGLFMAASDADSEGVEGKYFVWDYDEFTDVVASTGDDPQLFAAWLGVTREGNWDGVNVLHRPLATKPFVEHHALDDEEFKLAWRRVRSALLTRRQTRVAPRVDDKILADWNAYAIRALSVAGRLLGRADWQQMAQRSLDALIDTMVVDDRLRHATRAGRVSDHGFLEDHAAVALACLETFGDTGDQTYFDHAIQLAGVVNNQYADPAGGWYQTADDADVLYLRPKDAWDNATPAGSSVMVEVCLRLADLTGDHRWREHAQHAMAAMQNGARQSPTGFGWLLRQYEALAAGPRQVAIVGEPGSARDALVAIAGRVLRPGVTTVVTQPGQSDSVPLLSQRSDVDGVPAAYVCRDLVCALPVTTQRELAGALAL